MWTTALSWLSRLWGIAWLRYGVVVLAVLGALYASWLGLRGWADGKRAELVKENRELVVANGNLQSQLAFQKNENRRITADLLALKEAYEHKDVKRDFNCNGKLTVEYTADGRQILNCEGEARGGDSQTTVLPPPIQHSERPDVIISTPEGEKRAWMLGAGAGMLNWHDPTPVLSLGHEWERIWLMVQGGVDLGVATVGIRF